MENISKLIPVLYKKNETNFKHNGLGLLSNLLANQITEALNGEFEAFFEYPANGRLADKIDTEMLIKAKPNKKDEPHVFKVYDYELDTFSHTYLIYARSKNIEDLRSNVVLDLDISSATPMQAWNLAKKNTAGTVTTNFYSDINTRSSAKWSNRSLLSTIAGQEQSMIQHWGGEIKHENNQINLYRRRGQDNVTTVRHGKNLSGLTATYSTKGLVTAIVPYHSKGTDEKKIYGNIVQSKYVNTYSVVYYEVVEYNSEELGFKREDEPEDEEIRVALNKAAKDYFAKNVGVDLPSINMKITLEDISQTKEYERFKNFEQIEIGDTVTVYSQKYKLNIVAKVRKVVYNGLTDKNEIVEVGSAKKTIYDDFRENIDRVNNDLQTEIGSVQIAANGKNKIYRGLTEPTKGMKKGDLWYKPIADGEVEMYQYDGERWVFIVGSGMSDLVEEELAIANQKIQDARDFTASVEKEANSILAGLGLLTTGETHAQIIKDIKNNVGDQIYAIKNEPGSTILNYQRVTENVDLYERVIGSRHETDNQVKNNVARLVMGENIFKTSVSNPISLNATRVTQLENSWSMRIESNGDLVAALNANPKGVNIMGKNITLDGDTYVKGDFTIDGNMVGSGIKANNISTGTLNAANVDIINLNANSISTGLLRGIDIKTEWANRSIHLSKYGRIHFDLGSKEAGVIYARPSPEGGGNTDLYVKTSYRLRTNLIAVAGDVRPEANDHYWLGNLGNRWHTIKLGSGGIDESSDARLKEEIKDIPQMLIDEFAQVKPKEYKMNGTRQFGYIAQDVESALFRYVTKAYGLDVAHKNKEMFNIVSKDESYLALVYRQVSVIKNAEHERRLTILENKLEGLLNGPQK